VYIFKTQNNYYIHIFCTGHSHDGFHFLYVTKKSLCVSHRKNILAHNGNKNNLQSKCIHMYNINPRIITEIRALNIMMFDG